jgi:hypothetical protein
LLPPSSGRSRYNPEGSHLRTHGRENLKSYNENPYFLWHYYEYMFPVSYALLFNAVAPHSD